MGAPLLGKGPTPANVGRVAEATQTLLSALRGNLGEAVAE